MKNACHCVYNVVQDEFFTQKIQKSQKSVFFVNTIISQLPKFTNQKLSSHIQKNYIFGL